MIPWPLIKHHWCYCPSSPCLLLHWPPFPLLSQVSPSHFSHFHLRITCILLFPLCPHSVVPFYFPGFCGCCRLQTHFCIFGARNTHEREDVLVAFPQPSSLNNYLSCIFPETHFYFKSLNAYAFPQRDTMWSADKPKIPVFIVLSD